MGGEPVDILRFVVRLRDDLGRFQLPWLRSNSRVRALFARQLTFTEWFDLLVMFLQEDGSLLKDWPKAETKEATESSVPPLPASVETTVIKPKKGKLVYEQFPTIEGASAPQTKGVAAKNSPPPALPPAPLAAAPRRRGGSSRR